MIARTLIGVDRGFGHTVNHRLRQHSDFGAVAARVASLLVFYEENTLTAACAMRCDYRALCFRTENPVSLQAASGLRSLEPTMPCYPFPPMNGLRYMGGRLGHEHHLASDIVDVSTCRA